jgi:signal transduction histidine kinase
MHRNLRGATSITGLRILALVLLVLASAGTSAQHGSKRILVLHSFRNAVPLNSELSAGIRQGLDEPTGMAFEIDSEALDLSSVNNEEYQARLVETYRLKYHTGPPSLIITTYTPALRFLLDHRREVFPDIPIVFCSAELSSEDLTRLPPDITGVTSKRDFAGTLGLMSRLQPGIRQIVVIVGSSDIDASFEHDAREALRPFESRFEFVWLRGLPLRELTETVKALPPHAAILYVLQFGDRDGTFYVPWNVAQAVSAAASVPVYGLWDTLMGSGIVGGRLISFQQQAVAAGKIARRILLGEAPAAIPVARMERDEAVVDARQLKRWNIDEHLLPEGSRILYRENSLWAQHRDALFVGGGLIVLQALWIVALLRNRMRLRRAYASLGEEHDHRVQAEELARKLRTRLGATEKQSTLGALAGTIAHEVNQPLIALKNYAQAAKRYIPTDSKSSGKLAELLAEMEGEADRAGAIIQKTRRLLRSGHVDAAPVELDPVLKEVLALMRPEADARGCHIDYRVTTPVPIVLADALQLQLVMVNLLRNAMDAMAQSRGGPISITVSQTADRMAEVSVADHGAGVAADQVEDIFEPLYTTREAGMGIGLATCRTIIEAHGGHIWYAPNPEGGAIFRSRKRETEHAHRIHRR